MNDFKNKMKEKIKQFSNKEYLDATFDEIDKVYGSVDKFFKECCSLDDNKLKALRDKYLQ